MPRWPPPCYVRPCRSDWDGAGRGRITGSGNQSRSTGGVASRLCCRIAGAGRGPRGSDMPDIESLLGRNRAFAESGGWRNTPRLPFLPFTGMYVITCIDPRTDPANFLGLEFGEAIVARAVGGRVTDAVLRDIS